VAPPHEKFDNNLPDREQGRAVTTPIPMVRWANQATHKVPGNTELCRILLL